MSWTLAGNMVSRQDSVKAAYPGITIWSIGDQKHQSKNSDHNPDARSIVHALDVMTYTNTAQGQAVLDWCLADTTDLEYVIFNRKIYSRSTGFKPSNYGGSDPHTDHVHISGKHGNTGYNAATGTGYDTNAEKYRPAGMGDDMPYDESEMKAFPWQYAGRGMRGVPEGQSTLWVFGEMYSNTLALFDQMKKLQSSVDTLSAKLEGHHHDKGDDQ